MNRTSGAPRNSIFNRKAVDFAFALLLATMFLWLSFRLIPKLGYYLILPAFAVSVRFFPAGIHAGRELDVVTYAGTITLLAVIIYGVLRFAVYWRRRDI